MSKIDVLLSGLKIRIEHCYNYMPEFCKNYLFDFDTPDITAKTDELSVLNEKKSVPTVPIEVCESLCIYRNIAEQLPLFKRFVFHGAAIEHGGNAYLFTAPSGTGKTTHISLWKKYLGDGVRFINGDKPIINATNHPVVCGTPWAGKEGYQSNISAQLKAVCVLKQAKTNRIAPITKSEAISYLMRQAYMPKDPVSLSNTLSLIGRVIESTPIFLLECDISEQAFRLSYETLTGIKGTDACLKTT